MSTFPAYGVDPDRTQAVDAPLDALRRRFDGRYPIDPFGSDPQLQDLLAPLFGPLIRVHVEHGEAIPTRGPALLVVNRGTGIVEPTVLATAMRNHLGRRLRVIGAPELPVVGDVMRKLGGVPAYREDLRALLRAGHLGAIPLGLTWFRNGAGTPPIGLLMGALGYPVIPVAVKPGGPLGLPVRPWRVIVGEPVDDLALRDSADPLAAAELAEAAREGVRRLLDEA